MIIPVMLKTPCHNPHPKLKYLPFTLTIDFTSVSGNKSILFDIGYTATPKGYIATALEVRHIYDKDMNFDEYDNYICDSDSDIPYTPHEIINFILTADSYSIGYFPDTECRELTIAQLFPAIRLLDKVCIPDKKAKLILPTGKNVLFDYTAEYFV